MLNPAFHAWSYYCLPLGRRVCGGLRNSATLQRYTDRSVRLLVAWGPILVTDWRSPSGSTLVCANRSGLISKPPPKVLRATNLATNF